MEVIDIPTAAEIAERLLSRAADKAMDDPMAALAAADGATNLLISLSPTMPWEFPLPIPRVIYEKLQLSKYVQGQGRL